MDSILNSVKKLLGVSDEDGAFDSDIVFYINSVFSALNQIGVGPKETFSITGPSETWSEFTSDNKAMNMVQSYMCMKVRLMFDPPGSSIAMEAIKKVADEYEWRLHVLCDKPET